MSQSLADLVKIAFLDIHDGHSTDDVVTNPELNLRFLRKCQSLHPEVSAYDANWKLLNLRKSSSLGKVTTRTSRLDHSAYFHASQIAARLMEDRFSLTVDRVLCDPQHRQLFDQTASEIAPDVSFYRLRKAALALRKARRLQPEIVKRIAEWQKEVLLFPAVELQVDPDKIPRSPGVYLFRDLTGYLYIGEAQNLRLRVAKHLDHSDRKSLAHYFWQHGYSQIAVELHAFSSNSGATKQSARRAYESDLIDKRSPRFNLRP